MSSNAARKLAQFILEMTDETRPRWEREQIEVMARSAAKDYLIKLREANLLEAIRKPLSEAIRKPNV